MVRLEARKLHTMWGAHPCTYTSHTNLRVHTHSQPSRNDSLLELGRPEDMIKRNCRLLNPFSREFGFDGS